MAPASCWRLERASTSARAATAARTPWTRPRCATARESRRRPATRDRPTPASRSPSRRDTARAGCRADIAGEQETLMTSKADFTDEEWTRLKRAPFVAGMAISLADPGGPIEALKETSATLKTVLGTAERGDHGELVREIARETAEEARQHKNPLGGFK